MVTRTGMINYDQPFYVDVAMKKGGLATAVLFQGEGKYNDALGWYSTYLQGLDDWTDCENNLKAVFWAYHKVSKLTLGGRVEIRSTHEVMGIIEQARFNLSVGRRMRYLELLEKHNLTVRIIKTKNEANRLFCDEGEPHCCEDEGIRDMKIRPRSRQIMICMGVYGLRITYYKITNRNIITIKFKYSGVMGEQKKI